MKHNTKLKKSSLELSENSLWAITFLSKKKKISHLVRLDPQFSVRALKKSDHKKSSGLISVKALFCPSDLQKIISHPFLTFSFHALQSAESLNLSPFAFYSVMVFSLSPFLALSSICAIFHLIFELLLFAFLLSPETVENGKDVFLNRWGEKDNSGQRSSTLETQSLCSHFIVTCWVPGDWLPEKCVRHGALFIFHCLWFLMKAPSLQSSHSYLNI